MDRRISEQTASYLEDYMRRHELDEHDFTSADELINRLQNTLDNMPETYREAFMLHRFEGKSYKEIAEMKHLSPKTIDYRIQQALKRLRSDLSDYLPAVLLVIAMGYLEGVSEDSSLTEHSLRNSTVLFTDS